MHTYFEQTGAHVEWIIIINFFFETSGVGIIGLNCVTSNGNKFEIVANQMNWNTNLDFSKTY